MPSAATKLGDWGEEVAGRFLERRGYQILGRKYRCAWGEIDLVARDGAELVFVEVRTRRSNAFGSPEESITAAKAERLLWVCDDYLENHVSEHPANQPADQSPRRSGAVTGWRIDLVSVRPTQGKPPRIGHLRNAVEDYGG